MHDLETLDQILQVLVPFFHRDSARLPRFGSGDSILGGWSLSLALFPKELDALSFHHTSIDLAGLIPEKFQFIKLAGGRSGEFELEGIPLHLKHLLRAFPWRGAKELSGLFEDVDGQSSALVFEIIAPGDFGEDLLYVGRHGPGRRLGRLGLPP
ncbi:MAG: hypothetical protein A2V57_05535 [Candidatus Aminicenantes bacterium RBG_19FT_COMBO_65_30]|nr:MAG: hypothetical protein A2V57_05535 [Candidatus Aminicenantes bacterium RBG_19FT_COMBO_65_30]